MLKRSLIILYSLISVTMFPSLTHESSSSIGTLSGLASYRSYQLLIDEREGLLSTIAEMQSSMDQLQIDLTQLGTYKGNASWYGRRFHGKRTANGDIFNMNAMTAASLTLPMGSVVKITNITNSDTVTHLSVIVTINDRGPYRYGRVIDLSRAAAKKLNFVDEGQAKVRIEVLEIGDNKYRKKGKRASRRS